MFAVRRGGRDRFFYDRWAALQFDRLLLAGPDETVAYAERLSPTDAPVSVAWLCGALFIDLDRRELLYWANQFFGSGALLRYYPALLAPRWPGWRTRWAGAPIRDFAAALGRDLRELADARARAQPLAVADDLFTRGYDELLASFADDPAGLAAWRASASEAEIRDSAEIGDNAWVTVRDADGALYDQRCSSHAWDTLLCAGPRLVALAREGGPRPDMLWPGIERDITETIFVDEASRTVHAWSAVPHWLCPASFCGPLWPGYTLEHDPGGPRSHVERSGRPFAAIRMPQDQLLRELAEQITRTMGQQFAPLQWLAREADRLRAESPGTTVRVETAATHGEPAGAGAVPPDLLAGLAALIDEVDGPQPA